MKRTILTLILVLICGVAQAKIKGNIIGVSKTDDNFIKVDAKFIDDQNTPDISDDEQVGSLDHRLWNPLEFKNRSKFEIETIIEKDLQEKAKGNLRYQYIKNGGSRFDEAMDKAYDDLKIEQAQIINTVLDVAKGIQVEVEQTTIEIEIDITGDRIEDEKWTLNPDGTDSKSAIIAVIE